MRLIFQCPGASQEQLAAGLAAAQAVFTEAGVSPYYAHQAAGDQERDDREDSFDLPPEAWQWSATWTRAHYAAIEAASQSMSEQQFDACLCIIEMPPWPFWPAGATMDDFELAIGQWAFLGPARARALAAAEAAFAAVGVSPLAAAEAAFRRDADQQPLTPDKAPVADAWAFADHAAFEAGMVGWKPLHARMDTPLGARLTIVRKEPSPTDV